MRTCFPSFFALNEAKKEGLRKSDDQITYCDQGNQFGIIFIEKTEKIFDDEFINIYYQKFPSVIESVTNRYDFPSSRLICLPGAHS